MRLLPTICSVILAVAILGSAAAAGPSSAARLRIADETRLTLVGSGFQPREHVRIVVVMNGRYVRTVTASAVGGLSARFLSVVTGTCTSYSIRATGDQGSRASIRAMPECPVPLTP